MPESQRHGFDWENDIKTKVFRLDEAAAYTAKHDVEKEHNRFNPNENVSIKTVGNTTLCMGDALRVFEYDPTERHTSIVIQYEQKPDHKVLRAVYEIDLDNRSLLWGSITAEDIQELNALVKSMPKGQRDADLDKRITTKKKELNAKSGIIQFNPKINSSTQRRLQCSIPKFATYPALVKMHSTDPIVRGVAIAMSFASGRRVRNCRV